MSTNQGKNLARLLHDQLTIDGWKEIPVSLLGAVADSDGTASMTDDMYALHDALGKVAKALLEIEAVLAAECEV